MSTLKYFFDVKNEEENKNLFKNLYIEKSEFFKKQGQHPVIFISFKDLSGKTWEELKIKTKKILRMLFNENRYLID